jgi:hypothetical protein
VNRTLRSFVWIVAVAALAAAAPRPAAAQELHSFTVSASGGIGGSADADPGKGFGNAAFQLGFSAVTEPRTLVGARLGRLGLGGGQFEELLDAELTWLTVAGEYRFDEGYYDAGIYLGLGGYRLDGTPTAGDGGDETGIGLVFGLTGEFEINRRFGVVVEFSGHYANLDQAQFFGMAHAGLAFHF